MVALKSVHVDILSEKFMQFLMTFLWENPQKSVIFRGLQPKLLNYDRFLWNFPRNVIRVRMNFRNSLCNAPARKASNQ